MTTRRQQIVFLVLFLSAFAVVLAAQITNVLNPASDLSGKTLVTAEGNRTISGTFTWSVPVLFATGTTGAPGIVSSADATTGYQLSVTSIGASLAGTQRWLLNASGMTTFGVLTVDNTGTVTTTALGTGAATASTFLRGDRTWQPASFPINDCAFRLTLTSGTPVTTADVTAATNIFVSPYAGNQCSFFDGVSVWTLLSSAEITVPVPNTTSTPFDVFCFNNSGTMACETLAWTNDTTRATALVQQNGVLSKTGALTRRFMGSARTTTVAGQTEDSLTKRWLCNYNNRVRRTLRRVEPATSWSYNTNTIHQANANVANQVDVLACFPEYPLHLQVMATFRSNGTATNGWVGIGEDSTTTFMPASQAAGAASNGANFNANPVAFYDGFAATVGRHFYTWLESGDSSGAIQTWSSNGDLTGRAVSGISGWIEN